MQPESAVNWWLRSPNSNNNNAYYVNGSGALSNNNVYNANNACPRPAPAEHRERVAKSESRGLPKEAAPRPERANTYGRRAAAQQKGGRAISDRNMDFETFASVPTLDAAYRKARRGKRGKRAEAIFEAKETAKLIALAEWLKSGTYQPAELDAFMIYEPKARTINAPAFRDKIVQRALTDEIVYPALALSIPDNAFAARLGMGQHFGVKTLEKHMRTYFLRRKGRDEAQRGAAGLPHRPMEEWDYADGWVVKGDVRKCFPSTNHDMLKTAVYPRLPGPEFRELLGKYIDQVDGLALGHQTSHICAVYYLSKALHYINQDLGCSLSGMYMDDWYVIVETREEARRVLGAAKEKFASLGYELNEKTGIFPLRHGIDFCGFHLYLTKTGKVVRKLRQSSKKRMKRRIKKWERDYKAGLVSRKEIEQSFQSWNAHASHGHTQRLRQQLREKVNNIYKEADNEQTNQHTFAGEPGEVEREREGR